MRLVMALLVALLAVPAYAQQSAVCKGKPSFDLGNGATGCLLGVGTTSIRKTTRRDDGQSKSSSRGAGLIHVALFGSHTEKHSIKTPRVRNMCEMFRDTLIAASPSQNLRAIVVRMDWPEATVPNGRHVRWVDGRSIRSYTASLNRSCRAVKHF